MINHAFRRKVFFMGFSDKLTYGRLLRIFILYLHPLMQLKYKMDPQIPRFYKFLMLYTRLVIIMGISFITLRHHESFADLKHTVEYNAESGKIVVAIFGLALLLIPIPMFMFYFFRAKYFLHIPTGSRDNSDYDYEKLRKIQEEIDYAKVYIDPNLPIKLLFLINAVPFTDLMTKHHEKVPFADGNFRTVGQILSKLDIDLVSKSSDRDRRVSDSSSSEYETRNAFTRTRDVRS